jgi:large subunit ribosomal protein L18
MKKNISKEQRKRRHKRIRVKISGTKEKPRFCVFKSNKHIYAQIIDDEKKATLVSASDFDIYSHTKRGQAAKGDNINKSKIEIAQKVGELMAQKAKDQKITKVVFDRGGFRYQGRVKALAEGARKAGLIF